MLYTKSFSLGSQDYITFSLSFYIFHLPHLLCMRHQSSSSPCIVDLFGMVNCCSNLSHNVNICVFGLFWAGLITIFSCDKSTASSHIPSTNKVPSIEHISLSQATPKYIRMLLIHFCWISVNANIALLSSILINHWFKAESFTYVYLSIICLWIESRKYQVNRQNTPCIMSTLPQFELLSLYPLRGFQMFQ